MTGSYIDCSDIQNLLQMLSENTVAPWRHLFLTTNWDDLLQRKVQEQNYPVQPAWFANTHVYHLNGTIEELIDNQHRSPFLLETDPVEQRMSSPEANIAFENIIGDQTFVVVGMSFECEMDRFLLRSLARVQDDYPIRESTWIIINPDADELAAVEEKIRAALPHSEVWPVAKTFHSWLCTKVPELQKLGSLVFYRM